MDQCELCEEVGLNDCSACYLGNPCIGCEDREPTCHAHCIAYKAFRAKLDAEREEERKRRAEEKAGFTAYYYDAIRKKSRER